MKELSIFLLALLPTLIIGQNKEGTIKYEEKLTFKIDLPEEMKQYAHLIPTEKTTNMELYFDEDFSLYAPSKEMTKEEAAPKQGDANVQIMTMSSDGSSSEVFIDQKANSVVRSENVLGQQFLITSPIRKKDWKISNEQKDILGYTCIKAELELDSTTLTAWFSPNLPISIGPATYNGLPGMIMVLEHPGEKASRIIQATAIEFAEVSDQIEKPKKGKKVSEEEFMKLMAERLEEMGAEGSGGSKMIIKTEIKNN